MDKLEELQRKKPVLHAAEPNEPKELELLEAPPASVSQKALSLPRYTTTVKIYLLSTGRDPGSTCELRGWIVMFTDTGRPYRSINVDMPVSHDFSGDNNGRGTRVAEFTVTTLGKPASFAGFLMEEGFLPFVPDKVILNYFLDWDTAPWIGLMAVSG
ncbi:hypothetical protein N7444_006889 [Penicillium canescens]|nr:hypothetical protein N7444_006889 [Penicillium canescens]